jgi:inner membrane protein
VQTAILMLVARLRSGPRVSARWLLLLSFISMLTHPALDWLNTYGMRWLMPFRGTWFYGDSVYIMDPLLWLILGGGWLAGRRATAGMIALWIFFTGAIAWVAGRRSPDYLIVIGVVAAILLVVLLWRTSRSFAVPALVIGALYITARLALQYATTVEVRRQIGVPVAKMMVGPNPLDPRRWDVVAQTGDHYRYGSFNWNGRALTLTDRRIPVAKDSPEWRAARRHPSIRGFITWARFPWYEVERGPSRTVVRVHDARRAMRGDSGREVVITDRNTGPARAPR